MQLHALLVGTACVVCASVSVSAQDLCFEATSYAVGAEPSHVVLADFSGDGLLDMAVANHDARLDNRVSILVNNGDGTFAPSVFYEVGDRPYWMTTSDLNADGWIDLVVTNYFGASISVLINAGGAGFAPQVQYTTGGGPTFVAVGLFDVNGSPDLVVCNGFEDSTSILLNNGDGTFAEQVQYPIGSNPYGVATADFNTDGFIDVAASNYGSGAVNTEISVLMNLGDGTFAPHVTYLAGIASVGIAAVDLDNDGFADLVTANEGFAAENNTLSVLKNNGDGTFAPHIEYVVGTGPYSVATADFNADGFADVTSANEGGTVSILLNNGDGTLAAAANTTVAFGALGVATGDLDGNGTPEIAVACYVADEVWVLFNEFVGLALQPASVEAPLGGSATFVVLAVGPGPFTYQWRHEGVELVDGESFSGTTTDTLVVDPVLPRVTGTFDVVVTNECGSLLSAPATLMIASVDCPADLNGDNSVGGADLAILLGGWGRSGLGDLNGSATIDAADLAMLLGSWGSC